MCHSTVCHSPSPHLGPGPTARTKHVHASGAEQMEHFNSPTTQTRGIFCNVIWMQKNLLPCHLLRRAAPFSSNHYGRENVTLSTLGAQPALICRAKHDDVKDACHIINTGHCFFSRSISTRLNFRRADVRALSLPVQTTKPNRTQHSPSTSSHDQHELVGASLPTPCASTTKCCTMGAP